MAFSEPDYNLEVGSGSHAVQTANIMIRFEEVCIKERPDIVLVVGDVNSTIAAGLVAKKLHIALCHVEAGLRSSDRDIPEEINRLATDAITDIFFTTESEGTANLLKEGHAKNAVHFVGHVMIDNLLYQLKRIAEGENIIDPAIIRLKNALTKHYFCLTLHRPSNVDDKETLTGLLKAIETVSRGATGHFSLSHTRTRKNIEAFGLSQLLDFNGMQRDTIESGIILTEPYIPHFEKAFRCNLIGWVENGFM